MSHPVNDEILERLYEEALEHVIKKNILHDSTQKELEETAAKLGRERFEELSQ